MRMSGNKEDPGFKNYRPGTKVFLDGVELKDVITADEEDGLAIVVKRNKENQVFLDGGQIAQEEKRGQVRIEIAS